MSNHVRKLVVVGDDGVGKTALISVFCNGVVYPDLPMNPNVNEVYIEVDNQSRRYTIWDGSVDWGIEARLRVLLYPSANVFLVCFSLEQPESLDNVIERWMPEIKHFCSPNLPVLLVGCKQDLRDNATSEGVVRNLISYKQGEKFALSINALCYLECSALNGVGVREVFLRAIEAANVDRVHQPSRPRSNCNVI
ncbi:hypothetical protein M408DRAFT_193215 [Serendipita vermifera MAFF 305830]|uniref:Uncharacterized protein n=1 Tax=Serendipita vermifera MAFF 305830 TaxID=933852 RepID=A0A0C2XB69_SERVB|nr:hypothetical protein M408DRAFT_193215 [Serendipita vermifera MAFF 305830]